MEPGFAPEALAILPPEQRTALAVSRDFLRAVSANNLPAAMTLCTTPFFWNRKQTLQKPAALRDAFAAFFAEEGAQALKANAEEIYPVGEAIMRILTAEAQKFIEDFVGKSGLLYFAWFQDERLALFLKKSDGGAWRVAGFED